MSWHRKWVGEMSQKERKCIIFTTETLEKEQIHDKAFPHRSTSYSVCFPTCFDYTPPLPPSCLSLSYSKLNAADGMLQTRLLFKWDVCHKSLNVEKNKRGDTRREVWEPRISDTVVGHDANHTQQAKRANRM